MGESFIASVQYDDLTGTVAADGFEAGGPLGDLAKKVPIKSGYTPIGFGLNQLYPLENGNLPITVFAIDTGKVGATPTEVQDYAKKHGQLPLTGFRREIAPIEFRSNTQTLQSPLAQSSV